MKHPLILIALELCCGVSFAQQPISLGELTKSALTNHPGLVSARTEIDSARARRQELLAPFYPQISLNAYSALGSGSMIFPGTVDPTNYELLQNNPNGALNGTFMWRIFSFGRDQDLRRSGSAAIRSREAEFDSLALDVTFGVRAAFADAQFKRDSTAAQRAAKESALEVLRVTQARFEAGKVPEAFLLRAKAVVAAADREVAMAEAEESGSIATLWEAAGFDQLEVKELGHWDAALSAPATEKDALSFAMQNRPELVAVAERQKQFKALGSAANRSILPELSLMGMNDWLGNSGMNGASTYKAGLVLSFPLGDGGQRHAEIQEASASANKADAELRALRNHIQSEVVSAWAQWKAVPKILASAQAELDSSEEAYRIAMLRYQDGKAILSELIEARSGLIHAKLSVAEADVYQRKAWSKIDRAIGGFSNLK